MANRWKWSAFVVVIWIALKNVVRKSSISENAFNCDLSFSLFLFVILKRRATWKHFKICFTVRCVYAEFNSLSINSFSVCWMKNN